jgi:hypothetical protein
MKGKGPMNVLLVRATVKAEAVPDIEEAGKRIFTALEREQPQGFRYATCRLPDGVTFVNLWEIDDGATNPLTSLPEAQAFQEGLKTWMAEPPTYEQVTVVRSYRSF